jgi:hypothetical protein
MLRETVTVTVVHGSSIQVEDDYGCPLLVPNYLVVGIPRVGAEVTLVRANGHVRAFVSPAEKVGRITSNPDESGIVLVRAPFAVALSA